MLGTVGPEVGPREWLVQQRAVVRRGAPRVGVRPEEPAGHAHPGHGDHALLLQRRDEAHEETHAGFFFLRRERSQLLFDYVCPARESHGGFLPRRGKPQGRYPPVGGPRLPPHEALGLEDPHRVAHGRPAQAELLARRPTLPSSPRWWSRCTRERAWMGLRLRPFASSCKS